MQGFSAVTVAAHALVERFWLWARSDPRHPYLSEKLRLSE
jgi:hypothetical protein